MQMSRSRVFHSRSVNQCKNKTNSVKVAFMDQAKILSKGSVVCLPLMMAQRRTAMGNLAISKPQFSRLQTPESAATNQEIKRRF